MTHRTISVLALLAALAMPACAESPPEGETETTPSTAELRSENEKTLYALGYVLAQNMSGLGLSAEELEIVERGLEDGVLGREAEIDIQEYGPRVQQLARTRMQARAEEESIEATAFVEEMANREGAETFDSGLVMIETEEGSGASPDAEDRVTVHYHGTLRDGTVFDSSMERGQPATFALDRVIPCWSEALQEMQEGGEATIVCPPEIAYGDRGAPPKIPPGAALQFDVELIDVVEEANEDPDPPGDGAAGADTDPGESGAGDAGAGA